MTFSSVPPLRAFIIEDEPGARNYLAELLSSIGVEVVGAAARLSEAERQGFDELARSVDVCFIDINLGSVGNAEEGLLIARALAATQEPPQLVFATASRDHAFDALDLGSAGYLRKPFDRERVAAIVDRVNERRRPDLKPQSKRKIVGRSRAGLVFFAPSDVWAFSADTRLVSVHAAAGTFEVDLSLSNLEHAFTPSMLRVHRQWLVQRDAVRALERRDGELFVFVGDHVGGRGLLVPVARDRASHVKEALLATTVGLRP